MWARIGESWRELARVGESWRELQRVGESWRELKRVGESWEEGNAEESLVRVLCSGPTCNNSTLFA